MLAETVSLVTGGAVGMGRQIALTLAHEGSEVAIVDIQEPEGEKVVAELDQISSGLFVNADISEVANIRRAVEEVCQRYGRIDVLVNNAGISIRTLVEDLTEAQWDKYMAIDLKAAFFFSQAVCETMKRQGGGRMINIASMRGYNADKTHAGYSIAKAGLHSMTRNFAVSLAEYGVRVNSVSPSYVLTPMTAHNLEREGWMEWMRSKTPLGRLIEMQEVANTVLFLASDLSSGITGEDIRVDGGWLALE